MRVVPGTGPDVTLDSRAEGAFRVPRLGIVVVGSHVSVDGGCNEVHFGRCRASLTVHLPAGTNLQVMAGASDLSASGLSGNVDLETASGDVTADGLSGPVQLSTHSGDVTANRLSGPRARLSTDSGDVVAGSASVPRLTASTHSGDVALDFAESPHGGRRERRLRRRRRERAARPGLRGGRGDEQRHAPGPGAHEPHARTARLPRSRDRGSGDVGCRWLRRALDRGAPEGEPALELGLDREVGADLGLQPQLALVVALLRRRRRARTGRTRRACSCRSSRRGAAARRGTRTPRRGCARRSRRPGSPWRRR